MIQMDEEHRDIDGFDNGGLKHVTLADNLSSIKLAEEDGVSNKQHVFYSVPVTPETINSSSSSSVNLLVDNNTPLSASPTIATNPFRNYINDSNSSTPTMQSTMLSPSSPESQSPTDFNNDSNSNNNNNNSSNYNSNNNNEQLSIDGGNNNDNNDDNNKIVVIEEKKELTFLDTPIEIINYIFLNVGALNMPSLLRVNKFCFRTGMKEGLWSLFVQNDFGVSISDLTTMIRLNGGARSLYSNLYFKRRNSIAPVRSPNPLVRFFLKPISKLPSLFSRKEYKILMYGLDGVGKTTLLYKFARGEFVRTLPTNGYNVEVVEYKSCDFICWDIGYNTSKPVVPVWHHYIQDTQALIFIIDSTDRSRLPQVREELWKMLTDRNVAKILSFKQNDTNNGKVQRVKALIYANKIDKANVNSISSTATAASTSATNTPPPIGHHNNNNNTPMTTLEITLALSLFNLPKHIVWHVQGCSATSEEGDGLYEGLDWLSSQFEEE